MNDDGEGPPTFRMTEMTGDQLAMLELLGNPEIIGSSGISLYYSDESRRDGVPSIAPNHVVQHYCPVVMVLGRRRSIMPNGDLHETSEQKEA